MSKNNFIIFTVLNVVSFCQSYNWPCEPFNQQHWINGTFCECRSGSSGDIDHFHDGIDIHLPEGNAVYSVVDEIITSIGTPSQYGINSWIRAGQYAYVHVIPNTALSVGDSVEAFLTILGWTNTWNHIHFKDGYPGSERNAIRVNGGISPLVDIHDPHVNWVKFYPNNSTVQFSNNRVTGLVDIVCNATDRTDDGPIGDNNGIYKIGFVVLNQSGENMIGPRFPFEFNYIPTTDNYIDNVYFLGSNTGTYHYIITNHISGDYSLNVTGWDSGFYIARVMVFDQYFNSDTVDVNFEVVESDQVPPASPQLSFIFAENNGFFLRWNENQEEDLEGYRLYFSYDLDHWYNNHDESILTPDINEYHAGSFSSSTGYFKMTAVDNAPFPNESDFSDIYVFRKSPIDQGLLFIDSYHMDETPVAPFITHAGIIASELDIGLNSIHYSNLPVDSTVVLPDAISSIVLTGNQQGIWTDPFITFLLETPFCVIGSQALATFLSNGKGLHFLDSVGVSLGGNIPPPDQIIGFNEPFVDFNTSEIINTSLFDTLNLFNINSENTDIFPVIQDEDGHILAIASETVPFIISSIPLELFNEEIGRNYFFRITNYLTGINVSIDGNHQWAPDAFSIGFYPNPFNNRGLIDINGSQGTYLIRMFNLLGQLEWEEKLILDQRNNHQLKIPTRITAQLSSGVYFIYVSSPKEKVVTRKILYLK